MNDLESKTSEELEEMILNAEAELEDGELDDLEEEELEQLIDDATAILESRE